MCDIGSRRVIGDTVYFVTDKLAKKYMREHPGVSWYDLGGHSGIDILYPETKGRGRDEEGFPLPKDMALAWNRGVMKALVKNAYQVECGVNENGELDGEYREYYRSGRLVELCHYKDGKKHGEYKWWSENGVLRGHCFYVNGMNNGEYKLWDMDGVLRQHYFLKDGKLHGEAKRWNRDGDLTNHSLYENGILRTLWNVKCIQNIGIMEISENSITQY